MPLSWNVAWSCVWWCVVANWPFAQTYDYVRALVCAWQFFFLSVVLSPNFMFVFSIYLMGAHFSLAENQLWHFWKMAWNCLFHFAMKCFTVCIGAAGTLPLADLYRNKSLIFRHYIKLPQRILHSYLPPRITCEFFIWPIANDVAVAVLVFLLLLLLHCIHSVHMVELKAHSSNGSRREEKKRAHEREFKINDSR